MILESISKNILLTPSYYHFLFSEPPLNEEDVPPGEWLCPRCRAILDIRGMAERRKKSNHSSIKTSAKQPQNDRNKSLGHDNGHSKYNNTEDISPINHDNNNVDFEDSHKIRLLNALTARKNPFADLVRVSLLLNPREYELPEEYVPKIQFPGTKKPPPINVGSREARLTTYTVRRAQELDRNNLPLILRTCYVCRRGCRRAPLIHCDYCPLVYHADCVDPPLTILPNTRWMCPNHVEPVAEEKLLTSSSFCERVKLWNHFSRPIDHESIKISFLHKVHGCSSPQLTDSEFVKLGCHVPNRVKRFYDQFMVSIEKYENDSDNCDDLEAAIGLQQLSAGWRHPS